MPDRWLSLVTDLAAPMLAEPISQQSGAGAALYLMRQPGAGASTVCGAVCHHDPDHLHPGPLATVGVAFRPHPRLPVSTVPTAHRRHAPDGPASGAGLAAHPGDTAAFLTVFGPLHCTVGESLTVAWTEPIVQIYTNIFKIL